MMKRLLFITALFSLFLFVSCRTKEDSKITADRSADSLAANVHPDWGSQANIYEVNVRQYSPEGTFTAFEKSLPRLKDMGVDILWFMPINPIGLEGRKSKPTDLGSYYAVKDYYGINPEFGNMQDWKKLVKKAQEMGFKVIMDWVPNHSSPDNPWIQAHPDFYKKDSTGKPAIPFGWSDTRQLDYSNREMRDSMIAAMHFWLTQTGIDGFRCDVAWNVPNDFWIEAIASLRRVKPLFMLAEGESPGLNASGFDATYAWSVMNIAYGIYSGKSSLRQLDSVINHNDSTFPARSYRMYFTTNHDENSWNGTEFERFGPGYKTFAVWAYTMNKSVPLIYSGQEEPNRKRLQFFVKDTITWGKFELASFYKTLNGLRHSTSALAADASSRKIKTAQGDSLYAFIREKDGHKVFVILNFSGHQQRFTLTDDIPAAAAKEIFSGVTENLEKGRILHLAPWGYLVYTIDPK